MRFNYVEIQLKRGEIKPISEAGLAPACFLGSFLRSKLRRQDVNILSLLFRVSALPTDEQLGARTEENDTLPVSLALPPLPLYHCSTEDRAPECTTLARVSALTLFCVIFISFRC